MLNDIKDQNCPKQQKILKKAEMLKVKGGVEDKRTQRPGTKTNSCNTTTPPNQKTKK